MTDDPNLSLAILLQIVCHHRTRSTAIAAALGEPHERVVAELRALESRDCLTLDRVGPDDAVDVVAAAVPEAVQRMIRQVCPDSGP